MSSDTAAPKRILEVTVGKKVLRVATHGPHRKGDTVCIAATCCDRGDLIRVGVGADVVIAERYARGGTIPLDRALAALQDGGGCHGCAVHRAVMQAVTDVIPLLRTTKRHVALHAAIDELAASMTGHECDKETP